MWTIQYEFKCYLLVLVLGLLGFIKRKYSWFFLTASVSAAFIAQRTGLIQFPIETSLRLFMAFSWGGCFCLYQRKIFWNNKIALFASFLLAPCLLSSQVAELAFCIIGGYIIIHIANSAPISKRLNELPDISYGIYLYAWPINKVLLWHYPDINVYLAMATVYATSIIAATAS